MANDINTKLAYQLLRTPLGVPGSARLRYSAAMTLYQSGRLDAATLEVYRSCASLDAQDASLLIAEYGLNSPFEAELQDAAKAAILGLLAEIAIYLSTLPGPGVAVVRQGLTTATGRDIILQPARQNLVVDQHLEPALQIAHASVPALATAIRAASPYLKWITYDGYDPAAIGTEFARGHAYTSILGQNAPIALQDFDLGLFLIAPHVLYRDHNHAAPELYAPLTGPHGWRFGVDAPLEIKPAHQPIWNQAFAPHLTKVGPVPFLCIFGWTRDVTPLAQVIPAPDWAVLEALRLAGNTSH